jgi:hypothetical protein
VPRQPDDGLLLPWSEQQASEGTWEAHKLFVVKNGIGVHFEMCTDTQPVRRMAIDMDASEAAKVAANIDDAVLTDG